MRNDIIVGNQFPDFELPDHNNQIRKLSEIQKIDPLILVLACCFHSPDDILQHEQLVSFYPGIKAGYAKIVTITTEGLDGINRFRNWVGAEWTFLSDPQRIVQKDLDIQDLSQIKRNFMIPYTIILKPGLIIYKVYNGIQFEDRPDFENLRKDLWAIHQDISPNLDYTQPDLDDSWLAEKKDKYSQSDAVS